MTKKRFLKILMQFNSIDRELSNKAANFCWYTFGNYKQAIETISSYAKDCAFSEALHDDDFSKLSLKQKNIYLNKKLEEYVKLYIENMMIPYGTLLKKYNLTGSKVRRIIFPVSENITTYELPYGVEKFTNKDEIPNLCPFLPTYVYLADVKTDLMVSVLHESDKEDLGHFKYNNGCIVLHKDSIREALEYADNIRLCVCCYLTPKYDGV